MNDGWMADRLDRPLPPSPPLSDNSDRRCLPYESAPGAIAKWTYDLRNVRAFIFVKVFVLL